jgi:hypothetical protein
VWGLYDFAVSILMLSAVVLKWQYLQGTSNLADQTRWIPSTHYQAT